MLSLRPKLVDDRGARVSIATLRDARRIGVEPEKLPKPAEDDPALYRFSAMRYFSLGTILWIIVLFPTYRFLDWFFSDVLGIYTWIAFVMIVIIMVPFWQVVTYFEDRALAKGLRRLFRYHAHCPSCLYGIRDIEPDPDGCTICPECGAAWRLPPHNETEPRAQAQGSGIDR